MHFMQLKRHGCPLTVKQIHDGRERHPLYLAWRGLRDRARRNGQEVAERWLDFWQFVSDMGPKPAGKMMLVRIGNNGTWGPSNCPLIRRAAAPIEKLRFIYPVCHPKKPARPASSSPLGRWAGQRELGRRGLEDG